MSAHFQGWRLSAGDDCTVFDGANKKLVTVPCGGMTGRTVGESGDCAQLIAAAPDLLAALEELHLKTVVGTEQDRHDALNKAWAAITKAKGGAA